MKVKTKKQMNLPQLIEWALKNGIKNTYYVSKNRYIVTFDKIGFLESATLPLDEIFTVEEETEITEDTWFPKLVSRTVSGNYHLWKQGSINDFKYLSFNDLNAFYIPNDDLTMTLIWKNGKLVE